LVIGVSGVGEFQAAGGALQQARTQAGFQPRDAFAHRRTREMQALSGGGKAAALDAGNKRNDIFQALIVHGFVNSGYECRELMPMIGIKFSIKLIITETEEN